MPPQITCASALPGKTEKHENRIFTQMLYAVLVHCLNSTSCLISSIFLTHDSYDAVWLPKSRNQCVQTAGLLGAWFRRKEVESTAGVGLCCTHSAPLCCLVGFLFRKVMQKH